MPEKVYEQQRRPFRAPFFMEKSHFPPGKRLVKNTGDKKPVSESVKYQHLTG
jgi:hypothetical protein